MVLAVLLFAAGCGKPTVPAPEMFLQGGSQNVIFVGSSYLTQVELYRLGLLPTLFCMLAFLVIGTPWVLLVVR